MRFEDLRRSRALEMNCTRATSSTHRSSSTRFSGRLSSHAAPLSCPISPRHQRAPNSSLCFHRCPEARRRVPDWIIWRWREGGGGETWPMCAEGVTYDWVEWLACLPRQDSRSGRMLSPASKAAWSFNDQGQRAHRHLRFRLKIARLSLGTCAGGCCMYPSSRFPCPPIWWREPLSLVSKARSRFPSFNG